ncbi:hypothetical protein TIFTF001_026347 [Ficus carica]|uniref:RING-type E3 ubiquitin transferase n=1 Tax=Ficus carica TaxID=3494 RepID=A0AA88IY47_FICCA|nr:hypothetical protein TIFTF001_026347 [Ficus carica]
MDDNGGTDGFKNLFQDRALAFLFIAAAASALVVATYHFVTVCLCNRRRRLRDYPHSSSLRFQPPASPTSADGILAAELIPAHNFRKGETAGGGAGGGDCAVCLSEFEDGEEVRALPGCAHVFHATCIDMWLYSHTTCPICRANATPSPAMLLPPESTRDSAEIRIDFRVLEGNFATINQSRRS